MKAVQTPQDCANLASRPASSLRRTRGRSKGRVDGIDIDREVYRRVADGLTNFLDDAISPDDINLTSFNAFKAGVVVIVVILESGECRPNGPVL